MKTYIEIKFKTDYNTNEDVYTVVFDNDDLASIVRQGGLHAGNKAIDTFVNRFTGQFKQKLSEFFNR
jgi:hypothetical protein